MILILTPDIQPESDVYRQLTARLSRLPNIELRVHREQGAEHSLTEIYLIGNTSTISVDDMKALPGVERVVRVSEEYRVLGRHLDDSRSAHFDYKGLRFWAGHAACVCRTMRGDTPDHVEQMMRALRNQGQVCTAWARTNPAPVPTRFRDMAGNACRMFLNWLESTESKSSRWRSRTSRTSMRLMKP
jgi:3-deoxy-7-phosphoheptulonate synthase